MTFCMVTTFFGAHSFGGDAAFVDRLARALARQGHQVHVIYCRDAFEISRGRLEPRPYTAPPGVTVHALKSPWGPLSPLATHQTGQPTFKLRAISELIGTIRPDVVHFHNLSLIGGPGLLGIETPNAVKLMTAHEHWLVCPLSVLWAFGEKLCERRDCVRCCLQARRPSQWWRATGRIERGLDALDALIVPSESTRREHARRGITREMTVLPYFLPDDYAESWEADPPRADRAYLAAAGRFEDYKGFQDSIDAMRHLPDLDLRIAGAGRYEPELRRRAEGLDNVKFHGRLDANELAALFRGARAVVVPSLVYETFGYVVLEAFAEKVPVLVRNLGALPELVAQSDGGLTFDSTDDLVEAARRLAEDEDQREEMGLRGFEAWRTLWSEDIHLSRYLDLVETIRERKGLSDEAEPDVLRARPRRQPSESRV